MATLTSDDIESRIFREKEPRLRLTITPLLMPKEQIQGGSLDIRLGSYFLVFELGRLATVDPMARNEIARGETERLVYVPLMKPFVVHPHQFVLGSSLEYVGMPEDLMAYVVGRSSWGRLGLVIATAFAVHPQYRGIVTLELTNLGEVPIVVYPGWPIAQMFFHEVGTDSASVQRWDRSTYSLSVRPEPSRLSPSKQLRELYMIENPSRSPPSGQVRSFPPNLQGR